MPRLLAYTAGLLAASGCVAGGAPSGSDAEGPRLEIAVGALTLSGVADACYTLTVENGATPAEVVTQVTLSSSRYGDGAGSASYVAPCDAEPGVDLNTVRLDVIGLYGAPVADCTNPPASLDFQNPGQLVRQVTCRPNQDTAVQFDIALARPATQGFFDVAVNFGDVFCSAKLDCCVGDGAGGCASDRLLLHDASGARATTVNLALACAGGGDDDTGVDTRLYLDDITIDCGLGPGFVTTIVPSGAGNLCDPATDVCAGVTDPLDLLYQVQVSRGREAFADVDKAYWNVALGVKKASFPADQPCVLATRATADDHADPGGAQVGVIPAGAIYPLISWSVPLTDAEGLPWACSEHALGAAGPVSTGYTTTATSSATQLRNCFDPTGACCTDAAGCPVGSACDADGDGCELASVYVTQTLRATCATHAAAGETADGVYPVDAGGVEAFPVWCDMAPDGAWTLIMRGYGGDNADWFTTGEVPSEEPLSPTMAASFKLSDTVINAIRGGGIYRLEWNGSASPPSPAPGVRYVSGGCVYAHTSAVTTACRTWSASPDLSSPVVSATNAYRRGIAVGDPGAGSNYLSYLTNFAGESLVNTGWHVGDMVDYQDWCVPSEPGCDFAVFVRDAPPYVTETVRADCTAHFAAGETVSGRYPVDAGLGTAFPVYCDMTDGGWTLVMRGFGGQNGAWQTSDAVIGAQSPSPNMTESYKLSDAAINALRGGGIYRLSYNGTASPPSPAPPTVYVSGACTYQHLNTSVSAACRTWSLTSDLASPTVSGTNTSRAGIVVGTTATAGFLSYLTNFVTGTAAQRGWYAGDDTQNSDWCEPGTSGCNIVMFVRHD